MLTPSQAVVIGIIQGITEWLPISSKTMTTLVMIQFFGKSLSEAITFAIWTHIGTFLASIIYFRRELNDIIKRLPEYFSVTILGGWLGKKTDIKTVENEEDSLISFLIIATFMTGIIGVPVTLFITEKAQIAGDAAMVAIGIFLIFTGILQRISSSTKNVRQLPDTKDAFIIGLGQGLASIPGISRSGTTIGLFLFRKFDSEKALRYSYFMSIPAILGAEIVLQIRHLVTVDFSSILAVVVSFIVGLLTIDIFLKVARKVNFSNICIILGLMTALFGLAQIT